MNKISQNHSCPALSKRCCHQGQTREDNCGPERGFTLVDRRTFPGLDRNSSCTASKGLWSSGFGNQHAENGDDHEPKSVPFAPSRSSHPSLRGLDANMTGMSRGRPGL